MTIAARQTISNDLLDSLEKIINADAKPDAFTLKKLDRAADDLCGIDVVNGSIAKAGVAAIKWDVPSVKYWVKNALANDRSVHNLQNAAISLLAVNEIDGPVEFAEECYAVAPKDEAVVGRVLSDLIGAGHFRAAKRIFESAVKDGVQVSEIDSQMMKLDERLAHLGIGIEQAEAEMQAAIQVLRDYKFRAFDLSHTLFVDHDNVKSFVITVAFIGTIEDELLLEAALAVRLAEHANWNPSVLSIEFEHRISHGSNT